MNYSKTSVRTFILSAFIISIGFEASLDGETAPGIQCFLGSANYFVNIFFYF